MISSDPKADPDFPAQDLATDALEWLRGMVDFATRTVSIGRLSHQQIAALVGLNDPRVKDRSIRALAAEARISERILRREIHRFRALLDEMPR